MKRLYNLDYLRGLSAFGIMIYHYLFWTIGRFSADTFIGRIGIYGVAIFYILSGLTLYYVYYNKLSFSIQEILIFAKKRILRLFPLLWLATFATIFSSKNKFPNLYDIFLNLTGLFGFIKWDTYFATGAWSIGNELVFYVFFPFFIFLTRWSKPAMVLFSGIIFVLYLYFAFFALTPALPLSDQWRDYINPLNQVFLFLSGFLLGLFFHNTKINKVVNTIVLCVVILLFAFYPADGDAINLVTGSNRLVFTLSCCLTCLSFYKSSIKIPSNIHRTLAFLGEVSYSIYLLHPVVYFFCSSVSKHIVPIPSPFKFIVAIVSTLILSYFTYEYFEKYFIELGKSRKVNLQN